MRTIIRPMLLAGALVCGSLPVFASDLNIALDSKDQCNVKLSGNIQLENKVLAVALDNDTQLIIGQDKILYIDGIVLALDTEQQRWVDNYYDGINQAVPQAAAIATDAVALASTALNEVFTELLGSNNTALDDLSAKLRDLDQQIQYNFYADNGDIRLHSESFKNGEFFGPQWEANFEDAVQELVTDTIGHLMVAIGTQLIFKGGDMQEFEQKIQRFGDQIDKKVKYQSLALNEKANVLCSTLAQVDYAETQLQQIKQLASLDIIQVQDQPQRM